MGRKIWQKNQYTNNKIKDVSEVFDYKNKNITKQSFFLPSKSKFRYDKIKSNETYKNYSF